MSLSAKQWIIHLPYCAPFTLLLTEQTCSMVKARLSCTILCMLLYHVLCACDRLLRGHQVAQAWLWSKGSPAYTSK